MGTVAYHRPARTFPEAPRHDEVLVAAPPTVQDHSAGSWLQTLLPVMGSFTMVGFALIYKNRLFLLIAGGIVVLSLIVSVGLRLQQRAKGRRRRKTNRARYLKYIGERQELLESIARRQRLAAERLHPDPESIWAVVTLRRNLWERRPADADFLDARLGRGRVPLVAPVRFDLGNDPLVEYEPELLGPARDLVSSYEILPSEPVAVPLRGLGTIAVSGPRERVRSLVRSIVVQLATHHAPEELRIMGHYGPDAGLSWDWLKWLPHARDPLGAGLHGDGGSQPTCDLTVDVADLGVRLQQLVRPRIEQLARNREAGYSATPVTFQHVVLVVDGFYPDSPLARLAPLRELFASAAELHVSVLCIVDSPDDRPSHTGGGIDVRADGGLSFEETRPLGRREADVRADAAGVDLCEAVARSMAPLRLSHGEGRSDTVDSARLLDFLGFPTADAIDPAVTWSSRAKEDLLRVPIGIRPNGEIMSLDLKEAAQGGMGPHGLIVGATGSGKSELLRTLVTGLAITHPPDVLNFVFVDFKGGAAFAGLSGLPQSAGMITNLQRDLTMVDRMHAALLGEQERRQRLLLEAGNLDSIREYHADLDGEHPAEPFPYLLVIVDEFGQLLASRPDFLDLFVTIGRTGRSLGMHLLLATQRLDEGRIRGLEGHLRYRVGLRTFSAEESMSVLGTKDAFELPPLPGLGYLKVDQAYDRFKGALVTSPHLGDWAPVEIERSLVQAFDATSGSSPVVAAPLPPGEGSEVISDGQVRTEMAVAIERLAAGAPAGERAHQVWVPPLRATLSLDEVLPIATPAAPSSNSFSGRSSWPLRIPVGLVDRPSEQRQEPLVLDFGGAGGHLAVVGAPQQGKSTLLRTIICAFALTHSPRDVQFYCLDFGGGLHALEDLPHVGGVCGRLDRDKVSRVVREMQSLIEERALLFRRLGVESMAAYRARRFQGDGDESGYGDVFVVVDNWALLRQDFEDLEPELSEVVSSGLHYGIHVIIATNRWADMRPALRDNIGSRLELRLNDPLESEVGRLAAGALPQDTPGRGLTRDALQFQVALPRIDGGGLDTPLPVALEDLMAEAAKSWSGPPAPPIRLLPQTLEEADVATHGDHGSLVIGIEEFGLEPVGVDLFGGEPHFLVFGDGESGKTNLLRVLIGRLGAAYSPDQVQLAIIDYRRTLLDVAEAPNIQSYACTPAATAELAASLRSQLEARLPSPHLSPTELAEQGWWSGPEIVLVVDDYDLVAGPMGGALSDLVEPVAQARDIGFHMVVARRVGGAARSAFEPLLQRLQEVGTPGIVMSGDRQEGPILGGQTANPLPVGRGYLVRRQRRTALVQTVRADARPAGLEER